MKKPQSVPPFVEASERLDPLLALIHRCLKGGLVDARRFFENRAEEVNASLFPNLVRYFTLKSLLDHGQDAFEEDDSDDDDLEANDPFQREPLGNNGICLIWRSYRIRILKAERRGRIPAPGLSKAKRRFYGQDTQLPLFLEDRADSPLINVIFLWDLDPKTRELTSSRLACPRSYSETTREVRVHWNEPLPYLEADSPIPPDLSARVPTLAAKQTVARAPEIPVTLRPQA